MAEHPNQPTAALVEEKAAQLFSPEEFPQAMALLLTYGTHSWEREEHRVRLGMLKLCEGSLKSLSASLKEAHSDYRNILAWAEYPGEMRVDSWKIDQQTLQEIREKDRQQYQEWLNGNG